MQPDRDAVSIVIGGKSYLDWLQVDFDSDIFAPADMWSLEAPLPKLSTLRAFREGTKCDIYVGSDRQMSGYIDKVDPSGNRAEARLKLSGFDKGGYLLAEEADPVNVKNVTLKQLIQKLLKPSFGIKNVIDSNEENRKLLVGKEAKRALRSAAKSIARGERPRVSMKIDPGQKIATILDEQTQKLGLAWWITAQGDLFIGKPNYNQEIAYYFCSYAVGDQFASVNNIETWSLSRSLEGRYTEIQVNGMGLPSAKDAKDTAKSAPKFKGVATDPDLKARGIDRRLVLRDCDALSADEVQRKAEMEMGKARLAAETITITVEGFRDRDTDRLYTFDTLASVKIPEADIDGTYFVAQRRFTEDRGRRRTSLRLVPKDVWLS